MATFSFGSLWGVPLADARISAPIRSSGVTLGGDSSHVVVKNLTSTPVYNDGFIIHGKTRECLFVNIAAIKCGDDGYNVHARLPVPDRRLHVDPATRPACVTLVTA